MEFDPTMYDRARYQIKVPSNWFQCVFEVPESVREKMPQKQLIHCHGKHIIELDCLPQIGYEFLYPPVSDNCPSFYWEVVKVRQFPRRRNSRQVRIVSELFVSFGGEIDVS